MTQESYAIVDDSRSISYPELTSIINCTAFYYNTKGINKKDYIGIIGENSIEYVIAIFSLWKIGAIPVPINNRLTTREIEDIISASECSSVLISQPVEINLRGVNKIKLEIKSSGEELKGESSANPKETAVIIHTSGSRGKPKGVITTNGNLFESYLAANHEFNFSPSDMFLASLPFFHIGGFAIINRAILSGGTLVIPNSLRLDDITNMIAKNNPTVISLVPTVLKRLIERGFTPNSNLRILFLGGGPSDDDLILGGLNKGWPIVKVYGSSETTAMVTACYGENLKQNPASAGKCFNGVDVKIVSSSDGENRIGEIAIKGEMICAGYLNFPDIPIRNISDGFYYTGDYGYLDKNKNLFVLSRRKDLIVSGGENIIPQEIEDALNQYPGILESAVFGVEEKEWGEIVCAAIVLGKSVTIDDEEIKKYLKGKLASFKIPKKIFYLDELPKTELGKVQIEALKKLVV